MTHTVGWQFFATPSETFDVLADISERFNLLIFEQLRRPGIVVRRIETCSLPEPTSAPSRLFLTSQTLLPATEPGTLDAGRTLGLIDITLPFIMNGSLYLGSVGNKFQEADANEVKATRTLIKILKARAHGRLEVRSITTGASQAAAGVGFSIAAKELVESAGLKWKQFGVANIEFIPM